jgi:hypothetical protein
MLQDLKILRHLSGGSHSLTLLVQSIHGGEPFVRKFAEGEPRSKLRGQAHWLLRHQHLQQVPAVIGILENEGCFAMDLEWIGEGMPLNQYLKGLSVLEACTVLDNLIEFTESLPAIGEGIPDWPLMIQVKVYDKLAESIRLLPEFAELLLKPINVNGCAVPTVESIMHTLMTDHHEVFNKPLLLRDVHGDLTFENVLWDGKQFKFLDPNPGNLISDWSVDAGKILQSLHSNYEQLVEEGYFAETSSGWLVRFPENAHFAKIMDAWRVRCLSRFGADAWKFVRLQEAIHFARLLPYKAARRPRRFPIYALRMRLLFAELVEVFR